MKIKVSDLLKLNKQQCKLFMCDEYQKLMTFEEPTERRVKPYICDYIEENDILNKSNEKIIPLTHYSIPVSKLTVNSSIPEERINTTSTKEIDLFMINLIERNYCDMGDGNAFEINVYYYADKPIIISLFNVNMKFINLYIMNKPEFEMCRNNVLVDVVGTFFNPINIPSKQFSINGPMGEEQKIDLDKSIDPFMVFDANTDTTTDIVQKIFDDDETFMKHTPSIPSTVIHSILGYQLHGVRDYIVALPLTEIPRVSLVLESGFPEDEDDWDYGSCTIWKINLDGIPTMLFMMQDGYFIDEQWVYTLDQTKYDELRKIIFELYAPKFKDIPESEFITEDDEIEIRDNGYIKFNVVDDKLECIVDMDMGREMIKNEPK